MVEWSITTVLKTVVLRGTGGSNPSLSAELTKQHKRARHFDAPSCCFVLMYSNYEIEARDGLGLMAKNSFYDG